MILDQQRLASTDEALAAQLAAWQLSYPHMGLLAFLPEAEKDAVGRLQDICRRLGVPLAGAIFPALIADDAFVVEGVLLICCDRLPPHFLLADQGAAAAVVAAALAEACAEQQAVAGLGPEPLLFLIFDGMLPNVASILHHLHQQLEQAVSYGGVNAGSESFQPMPCLFDGERLVGQGVLGLLLPATTRLAVKHAYPVSKTLMRATSAVGNRIECIDNRPAFEIYREVIAAEYGIALTAENFYDYAVHFPFGLVTAVDVLVRIPVALNADGSLYCVGEVPPNSMLRLLKAPAADDARCVESLSEALDWSSAGARGGALLAFYCAGRRLHLGAGAERELAGLRAASGTPRLDGALSLGEIDQLEDLSIPRFHNAAIVCVQPG